MKIAKPHSVNQLLAAFQAALTILILFSGSSGILGFASEKLAVLALISVVLCLMRSTAVKPNRFSKSYLLIFGIVLAGLFYNYANSYSREVTQPYLLRFIMLFMLLTVSIELNKLLRIYRYVQIAAVFTAVIYIICWPVQGANGGLFQDYQFTAQTLSLSLGFVIPVLFDNKKIKVSDILSIAVIFLAILITGKRTLFIVPVIMILLIAMLSDDYKKYGKLLGFAFLGMIALLVMSIMVPSMLNSITRLLETSEDTTMSSRTYFWAYAIMLWKKNPLFGIGFGCFPAHIATGGVDLANYGYIRAYAAHNIYFQMLAEIGLVGLVLFCVLFILGLAYSLKIIKMIKRSGESDLMPLALTSLYCQLWFILYGITGNPLYMSGQLFAYFFGLMMNISIRQYIFRNGIMAYKRIVIRKTDFRELIFDKQNLIGLVMFSISIFALWGGINYLDYTGTLTDDVGEMQEKADYFWERGKTDMAIYQLSAYCAVNHDDMDAAVKLADWYEELGESDRALLWYQNAVYADIPDGCADIELTGAANTEVVSGNPGNYTVNITPAVKNTKDVTLSVYSENLMTEYVSGAVVKDTLDLAGEDRDRYRTSNWFPIKAGECCLTMYGGFNMANWQFKDHNDNVVPCKPVKTEGTEYTYRELNNVSLYNLHKSTIEIPKGACYARVTYLDNTSSIENGSLDDKVQIVYGRSVQADVPSEFQEYHLPDLKAGDQIDFKNGQWSLTSGGTTRVLDWEMPQITGGTVLSMNGTLPGRLDIDYIKPSDEKDGEYGVRWNRNRTEPVCVRTGDAVGLHFNYYIGSEWANSGINDFDSIYPWSEVKLCAINSAGSITYGQEAYFSTDGSVGDVFVEIPAFYTKRQVIGDYEYIWITANEKEGYSIDPAFVTESGIQKHIYVAAFQSSTDGNGSIESKSGAIPLINMSLNDIRKMTSRKGKGYSELDLTTLMMLQRLFLVETAVKNSQSLFAGTTALNFFNADAAQSAQESAYHSNEIIIQKQRRFNVGDAVTVVKQSEWDDFVNIPGRTQKVITAMEKQEDGNYRIEFSGEPVDIVAGDTFIYNIPRMNGLVDELGYCTGVNTSEYSGTEPFRYRYIENIWGNGAVLLDGCYEEDYKVHITYPDGSKSVLGYPLPVQNNLPGGENTIPSETIVKSMGYDPDNPMIMLPGVLGDGASFTDSFGDAFYMHENLYTVKQRVIAYGGCWDVANYAGLFNYRLQITEDESAKENTSRMVYRINNQIAGR